MKPEDKEGIEKLRNKQKAEEDVHKWKSYHHAIVKELTSGYQAKEVEIEDKGNFTVSFIWLYQNQFSILIKKVHWLRDGKFWTHLF